MKTIEISDAIELASKNKSLEGFAIINLEETQVKAKDALLLARNGIVIPEQNIFYKDEDVEFDAEFDGYEWTPLPKGISIEELSNISDEYESKHEPVFNIEIELEDENALQWAKQNHLILKDMFNNIFKGFYASKNLLGK